MSQGCGSHVAPWIRREQESPPRERGPRGRREPPGGAVAVRLLSRTGAGSSPCPGRWRSARHRLSAARGWSPRRSRRRSRAVAADVQAAAARTRSASIGSRAGELDVLGASASARTTAAGAAAVRTSVSGASATAGRSGTRRSTARADRAQEKLWAVGTTSKSGPCPAGRAARGRAAGPAPSGVMTTSRLAH